MSKLEKEFNKLKKRYKLKTKLTFNKNIFKNTNAVGFYCYANDIIYLPDRRFSRNKLLVLLHECCHAIQNKEGRLKKPKNHTRKKYIDEIEAEVFSIKEYVSLYDENLRTAWSLLTYDCYRFSWMSPKYKNPKPIASFAKTKEFCERLTKAEKLHIKKATKGWSGYN